VNNLIAKLALVKGDAGFDNLVKNSLFAGSIIAFAASMRQKLASQPVLKSLGNILSVLSFLILTGLFVILGAPQFAADKEGLALIALLAASTYIGAKILGSGGSLKLTAMDALVAGYLVANIIATFSSHYMPQACKGLSKAIVYVVFYFTVSFVLQEKRERLPWIIAGALVSGLMVTLYGLYQYKIGVAPLATWEDPTVESKGTRIYSTLGNPNLLAGYLLPLAPLSLFLGIYIRSFKNKLLDWLASPGLIVLSALIVLAVFLTGSRGGFLAVGGTLAFVVLGLSVYLLTSRPKLIVPVLIGTILVTVLGALLLHFLMPTIEQRILSIFAGSEHSSNAYRMHVWRASLAMFKDNWWIGVGPGNTAFRLAYGLYMKSGFDALGTYCVPLEVGVETGIFGLFCFCTLIFVAMCRAHLMFYLDSKYRYLALGLAAALVSLIVQGLVDTVFYRPQVHFLFWLIVASISALSLNNGTKQQS